MTIATAQWPARFDGLVKARDLKIEMANKARLSAEKTAEFVARAHNEFHASIAAEMKRRADHIGEASEMVHEPDHFASAGKMIHADATDALVNAGEGR